MRQRNDGFSLIEILVAFSIAAVALGIILQIYAKGTASAILGRDYAQALAIAESSLAELGESTDLNSAALTGYENEKYRWTIHISDFTPDEPGTFTTNLILKQVMIEVSWESWGRLRTVTLKTLRPEFSS